MAKRPFKLKSGSSPLFKNIGSSPVRSNGDDKDKLYVTPKEYTAATDTLQAYQHQNIGKPDIIQTGLELKIQDMIQQEHGRDSELYKSFKSSKRVHGDDEDFKEADTKLKSFPIDFESWLRANRIYWKGTITKKE